MYNLDSHSGTGFLESPAKANRQTATVWERFVATGQFGQARPRPVIAEGWRRCRDLGISPVAERAPSVMESRDAERILATASLGIAGREVLQQYASLLRGGPHALVLANASGHILYATGQHSTRERLERINFMPGGLWSEEAVGPNGVGTPLKLGRPEVILGTEHFCQGWQPWVCFGSPVRDPESGEVIGVIDITGPVRHAHVETMALTVAITQTLEQRLQLREIHRREQLHAQFLQLERRWPHDGLILLNRSGRILDANAAAMNVLPAQPGVQRNRRLMDAAPEITRALQGLRLTATGSFDAIEREITVPEPMGLRLEALRDSQGQFAGYLLVLRKRKAPGGDMRVTDPTAAQTALAGDAMTASMRTLRENDDELIRRTLLDCGGEMSRAARRLGIARSTLYRRLKRRGFGR